VIKEQRVGNMWLRPISHMASDGRELMLGGYDAGVLVATVQVDGIARGAEARIASVEAARPDHLRLATWGAIQIAFSALDVKRLVAGASLPRDLVRDSGFARGANGEELCRPNRWWENWTTHDVVSQIDQYWLASSEEKLWRAQRAQVFMERAAKMGSACEVGCGSGLVVQSLRESGWTGAYQGFDTSYQMLALAMARLPQERFALGDAFALPCEDGEFDVAICFEVLCHLPEISRPLAEICRAARHMAIFTVWVNDAAAGVTREEVAGKTFIHANSTLAQVDAEIQRLSPGSHVERIAQTSQKYLFIVQKAP
jgi:SAM-dependent methyltransferase